MNVTRKIGEPMRTPALSGNPALIFLTSAARTLHPYLIARLRFMGVLNG